MVSGVGASGLDVKDSPYQVNSISTARGIEQKKKKTTASCMPYLVMFEPHPKQEILRHSEDISQDVDLEFVKCLVHIGLQQCFQLMQPIFNL